MKSLGDNGQIAIPSGLPASFPWRKPGAPGLIPADNWALSTASKGSPFAGPNDEGGFLVWPQLSRFSDGALPGSIAITDVSAVRGGRIAG